MGKIYFLKFAGEKIVNCINLPYNTIMDLAKTKIYLDKLAREYARLSKDPENIVRIDVDIMASYVRELYDAVLSTEESAAPAPKQEPAHSPRKHAHSRPVVQMTQPAFTPPAPPPTPAPVHEEVPPAAPPPPVEEERPAPPPPTPSRIHIHHHGEAETLFEEKQAKEISEKLAEQPIGDLKNAIALNDRLLYTRELFAGEGKAFESAIASLNSFSNFSEAKSYLLQHCVTNYMWLDKKRVDEAKKFIKLVRRRYK